MAAVAYAGWAQLFFNLLNFGQMYSWHVLLLPMAVVLLVVMHVLLVRKHGVVPPFSVADRLKALEEPAAGDAGADRAGESAS